MSELRRTEVMVQLLIFKEKLSRLVGNSPAGNIDKRFEVVQKRWKDISDTKIIKDKTSREGILARTHSLPVNA